jgi:hypothetical protein
VAGVFLAIQPAPLSEIVLVFRSVSTDAANSCVARLVFSTSGFHRLFATKPGRWRCALFAPRQAHGVSTCIDVRLTTNANVREVRFVAFGLYGFLGAERRVCSSAFFGTSQ